MELRSIENQDLVNLANCDSEPIHIPGSIQPHGFLLALNSNYEVKYCSANLPDYGLETAQLLNKSIYQFLGSGEATALAQYLDNRVFESAKPHVFTHLGTPFNTTVHLSGNYLILEFEPFPDGSLELGNLYLQTQNFTRILSKAIGLQELCQRISEEVRKLTGYDRVMIYKFDENYNGEVYAEAKNDNIEPFLGLHYPHTDIPVQARALYMSNLMRQIVNVNYKPVPIVTLDAQASNQNLDLSHSVLRSVSPIHVAYLKNMGVSATLTISLIKDERLWGMITCHHYSPKNNPHYVRLSALLQGHFLTSQIRVQEAAADYGLKMRLDARLADFLSLINTANLKNNQELATDKLAAIANASGVCIINDSAIQSYGSVPADKDIMQLTERFSTDGKDIVYSHNIVDDFSIHLSNDIAGLLYYRLDEGTFVIWFRNELKKEIIWAGDPEKAILKDDNGLSPRKSFASWKQIISNQSSEWLEAEVAVAGQCVYAIQKHLSFIKSRKIQRMQSRLLKRLKQANEELENINWISTHDLKEPLRKIRVFSSILLDEEKYTFEDSATDVLRRMSSSAERMQHLIEDLMSFSRLQNNQSPFELTELDTLLQEVLADNEDLIREKSVSVLADGLPEIYCVPVLIRQLFSNLIGNSLKFARGSIPPVIRIGCAMAADKEQQLYNISFADNGQGFDNKYSELIFKVFQRLDKTANITGTGIGLAICKKIVEIHKGHITAEGVLNGGARFTISLPYNPAGTGE